FFFLAEDGIRYFHVTGVQTCALPIWKCVRLRQGDYEQETVFSDNPATVASEFAAAGARHLHLVDLDGAREGLPVNLPSVQDILEIGRASCRVRDGIPRVYGVVYTHYR